MLQPDSIESEQDLIVHLPGYSDGRQQDHWMAVKAEIHRVPLVANKRLDLNLRLLSRSADPHRPGHWHVYGSIFKNRSVLVMMIGHTKTFGEFLER